MPSHAAGAAGSLGLGVNWAVNGAIALPFSRLQAWFAGLIGPGGIFFAFSIGTAVLTVAYATLHVARKGTTLA